MQGHQHYFSVERALATDFGMMASALADQLTFFKVKKKNHFNLGARRSDRNGDNLFVDAKCFFSIAKSRRLLF